MKMKLTCGAVFCAAVAMTAAKAGAQTPQAVNDDLLLSFESPSGGTGASTDFEVNLGTFANPVRSINLNADLTAVYGSNWNTDANLFWSVLGTNGSSAGGGLPADTLFVSTPDSASFPNGAPSDAGDASAQIPARSGIDQVYISYNQGSAGILTNSAYVTASLGDSFTSENANDFEDNLDQPIEQAAAVGSGSLSADLYELDPTGEQQIDINTFTLSSNGQFTAAVPEPSTWATMILGAVSLLIFGRRRLRA